MFAKIKGKLDNIGESYVIVDVNGVGYKVFVTSYIAGKLAGMDDVQLYIHTHVREDAFNLFGFLEESDLNMFELLISISGIGPKAALGILNVSDAKTISIAISNEDPSVLTKVSGIGKKTAEKIIIELKNKIKKISTQGEDLSRITADGEVLEALVAMGYSVAESREALKKIDSSIQDVGEKVKHALKGLGK